METDDLFEKMIDAACMAGTFSVLGGECDEFMRFLELEWHSFDSSGYTIEQLRRFNLELKNYKKYKQEPKRNWRKDFDGRDFTGLII